MLDFAIIGGTGVYDPQIIESPERVEVRTPYGPTALLVGGYRGRRVGFMNRHGAGHAVPPHRVNYRANIWALRHLGAQRVLATAAVGSANPAMEPGQCVVVSDFIDWTRGRTYTFFEGGADGVVHTDVTEPYCREMRRALVDAARALGIPHHDGGVYVCTEGPRFETPAEIRAIRALGGDLVGMTNVPEVVLARELGLCYGLVALVTNKAAGMSGQPLTHEEVLEVMARNAEHVRRLAMAVIESVPAERGCGCKPAGPMPQMKGDGGA